MSLWLKQLLLSTFPNQGFELLQGRAKFEGKILGGCIDSLYNIFSNERYADSGNVCRKYELFHKSDDWQGKILLLESSEEQPAPEEYRKMLVALKQTGIFKVISGVLAGKPMDEKYADEYKELLVEVIDDKSLPIVFNINVGHATPRCIIPFGVHAVVDIDKQTIRFR